MQTRTHIGSMRAWAAGLVIALGCTGAEAANRSVDQHQAADAAGTVEIINVAGTVQVHGWDKAEVAVTGTIGEKVEKVEVTGEGKHTTVRVVLPKGNSWGGDGSADLVIQVPRASTLDASLVSADITVNGVTGPQQLRTVSGDITAEGGGGSHINTVSGTIKLGVANGAEAKVSSISGDMAVNGAGGDVSIETVSGDGRLSLGTLNKFQLQTVSGDFKIGGRLASAAEFDVESVSGDVSADFSGAPGADFDLQTLSGGISDCSGHKAVEPQYGVGEHLNFTVGDGKAKVHMVSKSGDLSVCAK